MEQKPFKERKKCCDSNLEVYEEAHLNIRGDTLQHDRPFILSLGLSSIFEVHKGGDIQIIATSRMKSTCRFHRGKSLAPGP